MRKDHEPLSARQKEALSILVAGGEARAVARGFQNGVGFINGSTASAMAARGWLEGNPPFGSAADGRLISATADGVDRLEAELRAVAA